MAARARAKRAAKPGKGAPSRLRRKPVASNTKPAARPLRAAAPTRANGADTLRAVEQLLYRQAELLDTRRWADFIELFAEDGIYWAPASPDQTTGDGVPSIFHEDRDLMTVRMKRITHPHAWSQAPDWGTNHVVSNVMIESENPATGEVVVRSRFHMLEFRRDATRHFAGSYLHHLKRTPNGYRITLQRVDLVNGQGPYDYVLQAWV